MPEKEEHREVIEKQPLSGNGTAHQSVKMQDRVSEIRSDEVQEILSHVPNWMIRWGITLIFGLIGLLLFLSWMIRYPDMISGNVTLTTEIPPVKLVSKTNGEIRRIYVREGITVNQGDFIAEIQNPLNEQAITYLKSTVFVIDTTFFREEDLENITTISFKDSGLVFGEMQTEYNNLKSAVKEYELLLTNTFRENKIRNLKKQLKYYERLATISNNQLNLSQTDIKKTEEKYQSDKRLFEKGVISKMEFYAKEKELTAHRQEVENLKKTYVQNNITIAEYEKQLDEFTYDFSEKERKLKERIALSMDNLNNFMHSWQQNYVIAAPFSGKVSYLSNLSENQFIQAGVPLFAVIPENNHYIGHIKIPAQGFGKVKTGQKVHIKLDNYPYHEYGQLNGEVVEITQIPSKTTEDQLVYLAKVKLINGLTTTYQKELEFKPEMSGTAEIVTEDLRLIERVFNQFKKVFDRE